MLVKNVSQTVKIPVSLWLKDINSLEDSVKKELMEYAKLLDRAKTVGIDVSGTESHKEAIIRMLPDSMKEELKSMGCDMPTDQIELTMKLGDFLYHLYAIHTKRPESPLAIKRHEKRLLDLAEAFEAETIEVPKDALQVASDVLSDDKKWSMSQFGAILVVGGEQKYLGVNSRGAKLFTEVIDAAVSICMESEQP